MFSRLLCSEISVDEYGINPFLGRLPGYRWQCGLKSNGVYTQNFEGEKLFPLLGLWKFQCHGIQVRKIRYLPGKQLSGTVSFNRVKSYNGTDYLR